MSSRQIRKDREGCIKQRKETTCAKRCRCDRVYYVWETECLKTDHGQLNKWKCGQLCSKAWLWKEGKGEPKRGLGLGIEHVCSLYRGEAVFEQEPLEGEVGSGHRRMEKA